MTDTLRRSGYERRPRTSVRDRLVPPFPEPGPRLWRVLGLSPAAGARLARWSGWGGPVLVALLAGVLRFWRLGSPRALVFDETYYAKDAWSLLRLGYESTWPDRKVADPQILADPQVIPLSDSGAFVAHPPTGKWVIALGEWMFGLEPFGWRFMTALLGTLSVLVLCRIGRRLFRSTALGCLAGTLMALDGLHFVMSRHALLDLVVMFFVLAAFGCLLIDRDGARARLAAALPPDAHGRVRPDGPTGDRAGTGLRPWRPAAGALLGLAVSTKWNGLYFLAFFVVLTLLWDVGARRVAGAYRPYRAVLRKDLG
ncbi:MAG: phospholipid carrier-dependent glycosyltransferase, partial [Streptomyces sp.]|nr:phospholipid carrier-dependent glycosyltransferase [Streptomyces sp.]